MKSLLLSMAGFLLPAAVSLAAGPVVQRDIWSYDRAEFRDKPEAVKAACEKAAAQPKGVEPMRLAGWAEFDFTLPATGWYELWFNGAPPEWSRDVSFDGKTVSRLGISETEGDGLPSARKNEVRFKEVNVFLTQGSHTLRYRRLGFPAWLPSVWALLPSEGKPGGIIHAAVAGSRIVTPGESVTVQLTGGGEAPAGYELFLKNEMTDALTPVGQVDFPATKTPVEKTVTIPLKEEGLYTLRAKSGGELLRPSDLKSGYFLAAKSPSQAHPVKAHAFAFDTLFSNGAVLQRGKPLPVWGWAEPGSPVEVSLAGQTAKAAADANGRWQVTFQPLPAGGPHTLKASCNGKEIVSNDVLVGEVWLLSGQSNTGGPLIKVLGGEERAKKASFPQVRVASIFGKPTENGEWRTSTGWLNADFGADAKKMERWIAIPFVFGSELNTELGVPVGILQSARGGTMITAWTSRAVHESNPSFKPILDAWNADEKEHVPEQVALLNLAEKAHRWRKLSEEAKASGAPAPAAPRFPTDLSDNNKPSGLYESLIEPLAPFALRGFLWYQGESDSGMASEYRNRFPAMIANWRALWKDPALPFLYVQIAYGSGAPYRGEPGDDTGSEMKEVQLETLSVPGTAMVATNDLMRPEDDVHYHDKLPVGHRLALAALSRVYEKNVEYSGPLYKGMKVEGKTIRLSFSHLGGGLVAGGEKLGGFAIAGQDRKWVWADAKIEGETVLVSNPEVPDPAAVRYSWAPTPCGGNLFNKAGLPAPVFRTDDWPMITAGVFWVEKN